MCLGGGFVYYLTSNWLFLLSSIKCLALLYSLISKTLLFGLQNNLAIIHPLLILLTYSCLLILLGLTKLRYAAWSILMLTYILFTTLFLGGWWAFQEFNWGGWWNWDGIETPIFWTAIFITYVFFHKFAVTNNTNVSQCNYSTYVLYMLVIIILLPRFGNTNSIHSFINLSTNYLYYTSHIFISSINYGMFQIGLRNINFVTFFFVKSLCLVIVGVWGSTIFMKNFTHKAYASHKIIYIIGLWGLCLNIKPLGVLSYNSWEWDNVSMINNYFFNKNYLFWIKPNTTCLPDVFRMLNYFLN